MNSNIIKNIKKRILPSSVKETWVISVGGYGSFLFNGSEVEAEEFRKHKANWEKAAARKRLADRDEIHTGVINQCKNHPNFNTKDRYHCECNNCKPK